MNTVKEITRRVWPEWELQHVIGSGAYGEVYLAVREDVTGRAESAIKIVKIMPQNLRTLYGDQAAADAAFQQQLQRFAREIDLMRRLKGQTNVVDIEDYKVTEDDGVTYLLIRMELLTPLLVDLDIHPWTEEKLIRIGRDVCRALEVCESMHIAHRDIRPENILVNALGDYKLGDFGVARTLDADREVMTSWEFTLWEPFIAPEVKNGQLKEADFQEACMVDIYALGILLYWIASGRRFPFLPEKQLYTSQDRKEAEERRLKGEQLPGLDSISDELEAVILKACAFDPQDRFTSARAFREALEAVGSEAKTVLPEERHDKRPSRPIRRWVPLVAALSALVVFLALFLLVPVHVPVMYETESGELLLTDTVSLRPGTSLELLPSAPEGYAASPASVTVSSDLLRRPTPGTISFLCDTPAVPTASDSFVIQHMVYPHVLAIGQPFQMEGFILSPDGIRSVTLNLYTEEECFSHTEDLPDGTSVFSMDAIPQELFYHVDEGSFWLEIIAIDGAGRMMGFSHNSSASYLEEEHVLYTVNRTYGAPELRGTFVHDGHTYEIYRLPGGGWDTANTFAMGKGGHLVSIGDEQEFGVLTSYCQGMGIMYINIGLERNGEAWMWVDGTPYDFHPWKQSVADTEPIYPPVGSMIMTADMQWHFGKATQYEIAHFMVEYDDFMH